MTQPIFGIETEYALSGPGGPREVLAAKIVHSVAEDVASLPGMHDYDRFLANGSRLYVDCGAHPELSTPECTTPTEALTYIRAGEALLTRVIERLSAAAVESETGATKTQTSEAGPTWRDELRYAMMSGSREAVESYRQRRALIESHDGSAGGAAGSAADKIDFELFRSNIDYSGAKTTWGSHESYLYKSDPKLFPDQIIPHLVSRVIYTGAGGFNPFSVGIEFTLSPRAWHLQRVASGSSTERRGIFHFKNEPLAKRGYNRLHLLCGETLCSDTATWLRIGTTAIVVAMIDAGLIPGEAVKLRKPLAALRAYVADPYCQREAHTEDGQRLNAVTVQRHYLQTAEDALGKPWMPDWAGKVCEEWRRMLDRLDCGPDHVCTQLDWAIKLPIYRDHIERKGFQWDDLPAWNWVNDQIRSALSRSSHEGRATVELVLGQEKTPSPIPEAIVELTPYLEDHGLSWDMLRPFVNLRKEMFELDFRFGQLGERGLFGKLDRDGVLEHHVDGVDRTDRALHKPPASGRACLRGRRIKKYSGLSGYRCYWNTILDFNGKRKLLMSDPFETKASWRKFTRREREQPDPLDYPDEPGGASRVLLELLRRGGR
ncbi:MAG: proteasome accessory factor PafA2 family protein [Candidatus Latescibacterota bacterium]|nr:MAG: proteasome accessory factor PafA2 family protein [Candidatus Latescibacterota bacterium]